MSVTNIWDFGPAAFVEADLTNFGTVRSEVCKSKLWRFGDNSMAITGGSARLILVFNFLGVAGSVVPCPFKECSCGQTVILCSDRNLVTMPRAITVNNTYFTSADFDRNNFTVITSGSLPANLTDMSFQVTPITTIEDDAFDGSADTLTSLMFYQARFIQLPAAFGHLRALNFLSISNSSIQDWNLDALKPIGATLNTLDLEDLVIKEWPSWLQFFKNLTDLSMGSCHISDIPDNGLDAQISTLVNLVLNENSLKIVPKAISKLTALKFLALNKNKIKDVKWLPVLSKLQSLSLSDNKLFDSNQLSNMVTVFANTLNQFEIHTNLLTSFPRLDFLIHIDSLDFNYNKINDPNSGSLPVNLSDLKMRSNDLPRIPRILSSLQELTEVYLRSNAITEIEGTAFPPFSRGADLENNLISQIRDTSFPVNSSITYVILDKNPIVYISVNAFVNLPQLVQLSLQYTKLTRLPLALTSLVNINDFDISFTDGLVCTCEEKSLQDWIKLMSPDMVKGTCGQASILYFFTVLSPYCP